MARGEIGENIPFIQLDEGIAEVATRLATMLGQDYQRVIGCLYVFWHGLSKRKRLYRGLLLELKGEEARVLLEADELGVRLHMAFGVQVDPRLLVAVDVLELEPTGLWKVCGMDRYIDMERRRLKTAKKWPPTGPDEPEVAADQDRGPTPVPPRSNPGGTRNQVKPTGPVQCHPGGTGVEPGLDGGTSGVAAGNYPAECRGKSEECRDPPPVSAPVVRLVPSPTRPEEEETDQPPPPLEAGEPTGGSEREHPDREPRARRWSADDLYAALRGVWLGAELGFPSRFTGLSLQRAEAMCGRFQPRQILGAAVAYLRTTPSPRAEFTQTGYPVRVFLNPDVHEWRMPAPFERGWLCAKCRDAADPPSVFDRSVCQRCAWEWRQLRDEAFPVPDSPRLVPRDRLEREIQGWRRQGSEERAREVELELAELQAEHERELAACTAAMAVRDANEELHFMAWLTEPAVQAGAAG